MIKYKYKKDRQNQRVYTQPDQPESPFNVSIGEDAKHKLRQISLTDDLSPNIFRYDGWLSGKFTFQQTQKEFKNNILDMNRQKMKTSISRNQTIKIYQQKQQKTKNKQKNNSDQIKMCPSVKIVLNKEIFKKKERRIHSKSVVQNQILAKDQILQPYVQQARSIAMSWLSLIKYKQNNRPERHQTQMLVRRKMHRIALGRKKIQQGNKRQQKNQQSKQKSVGKVFIGNFSPYLKEFVKLSLALKAEKTNSFVPNKIKLQAYRARKSNPH